MRWHTFNWRLPSFKGGGYVYVKRRNCAGLWKGPIKDTKSRYAQESLLLKSNYNSQQKIYNSIEKIETIVSNITCLPVENQEYLNIVRYSEGGHYVPHYDFFLKGGEGYDLDIAKGGQRVSSVLFYLNDSYEGGVTQFPKLDNFEIAPRKGRAVYWNNFRDNKPIEKSLHCSLPVEKGFKWIGIVWVREGEYSPRKG